MSLRHLTVPCRDEGELGQLARKLAQHCPADTTVYLQGELGAGKTTLAREWLRALGVTGVIKSPTYTLVEVYELTKFFVFHFDLYRLSTPEELYSIGFEDYLNQKALLLIEWPEKAIEVLPKADFVCSISYADVGRIVNLQAESEAGKILLSKIAGV